MASAAVMRGVQNEIRDLIRHAEKSGWEVSRKHAKLRFAGPDGAGPVYVPVRTAGNRDLQNRVHDLIRAGLQIGEHTAETIDGPTPVIAEQELADLAERDVAEPWDAPVASVTHLHYRGKPSPAMFAEGTLVPAPEIADVDQTPNAPADPTAVAFAEFMATVTEAAEKLRDAFGRVATAAAEATEWQALAEMAEHRAVAAETELAEIKAQRESLRRFLEGGA